MPTTLALRLPGTGSLPTVGIALALGLLAPAARSCCAGSALRRPRRPGRAASSSSRSSRWTSAGFTKPLRLVLEAVLRPQREIAVRTAGGVVQEVSYSGRVPHLIDERLYAPAVRSALVARATRAAPADRTPRHVRRLPDRARARAARGGEGGRDRMSGVSLASVAVELGGGLLLAPLLPGLVQHWKARLQGRRGPSPLQPYRELRRLWGKSAVDPRAPASSTAARRRSSRRASPPRCCSCRSPARAPGLGVGRDMLVLAGLLALARFAVAAAAWDVANGFSLMGASRDLTIAVSTEATLVLALAVGALVAGHDEPHRHGRRARPARRSGRTRRSRSARSRSRSSSSPRPGGSRSTTPTPTSS